MTKSRNQWPMRSYLPAWKTFRRLSDENRATAEHLITRTFWPKQDGAVLVDIGCGDGRLLESLILCNPSRIAEVRLIDPDIELLSEAATCVMETGFVSQISEKLGKVEDGFSEYTHGAHALLLVHVVYLLEERGLTYALENCAPNVPIYVVLDSPGSVFTALWKKTAPQYHARVLAAHDEIRALPPDQFHVNVSVIESSIVNPLEIPRVDIRDALLSILSYSDVSSSSDPGIRDWIKEVLRERVKDGAVPCESTCYEILPHS